MKKMNTGKLPIGQSRRKKSNFAEFSETNSWIYAGILGAFNFAKRQSLKNGQFCGKVLGKLQYLVLQWRNWLIPQFRVLSDLTGLT